MPAVGRLPLPPSWRRRVAPVHSRPFGHSLSMAVDSGANLLPVFDLKSASLTLVALLLKTTDLAELAEELEHRFSDAPDLFDNDPVVIDLSPVCEAVDAVDFPALIALLRERKLLPVAAKGGSPA